MDAILSMHRSGTNPNKAKKPQCGTRNGMDIRTANSSAKAHRRIFCRFIS